MNKSFKLGLIIIICASVCQIYKLKKEHKTIVHKNPIVKKEFKLPKVTYQPESKKYRHLKEANFSQLPQWDSSDTQKSLNAFRRSCVIWEKQNPNRNAGNSEIPLKVKDWLPICEQVAALPEKVTDVQAKHFFEVFFKPYHWTHTRKGKFTGYYSPIVQGSLEKTNVYRFPVYSAPKHRLIKHFSRHEIYNGALKGKAKVIAWLKSPIDAMALEIEGSGIIKVSEEKQFFVSYEAENGMRYRSIAQMLVNAHVFSRAKASMSNIKHYFAKHPEKVNSYVKQNPSYVFFKPYPSRGFKGAQGVTLTPKYSLAVDRRFVPLGMPLYLSTVSPVTTDGDRAKLNRVVIAQDVGGAIKGAIRGDIYWGSGDKATRIASLMENTGNYWMLLPRHFKIH